ncbi:MAG: hypothetical protein JXR63_03505 [Spirochaetales bacterium]|nr:hypothetical protein [Spirochaetales bacterium]
MKKINFIIILLIFCVGCLSAYDNPTSQVDRLELDWWKERHEAMVKVVQEKQNSRLVFIGDSITHAWGGEPISDYKTGDEVYRQYFSSYNPINLGISADRTEHVLWRLDNGAIDGLSPDYFVLHIGTNNIGHYPDMTPEDVFAGINAIIDKLKSSSPNSTIILMKIFPRSYRPDAMREKINIVNNLLEEKYTADIKVKLLDIGHNFLYRSGNIKSLLMPDFLHLSVKGYKIWAEALIEIMEQV